MTDPEKMMTDMITYYVKKNFPHYHDFVEDILDISSRMIVSALMSTPFTMEEKEELLTALHEDMVGNMKLLGPEIEKRKIMIKVLDKLKDHGVTD